MKIGLMPKRRVNFFIVFFLTFLSITFLGLFILSRFKPIFQDKASHAARVKAIEVINSAVNSVFSDKDCKLFVDISECDGEITSISANTSEMNKLKSELALEIDKYTKNAGNDTIFIPLGSLTNYPVLQGIGYRIPVKISLDGISKVDFDSEFIQSGINQVKHKVFMVASAEFSVISAAMTATETVSTEIPVAETVIVGKVPEYYGDKLSVVGR